MAASRPTPSPPPPAPVPPLEARLEFSRLFVEVDADGSNSLSYSELLLATHRLLGNHLSEADTSMAVDRMLELLDSDGDQTVTYEEYMTTMCSMFWHRTAMRAKVSSAFSAALTRSAVSLGVSAFDSDAIASVCATVQRGFDDAGVTILPPTGACLYPFPNKLRTAASSAPHRSHVATFFLPLDQILATSTLRATATF